jgi:hypothetical protein
MNQSQKAVSANIRYVPVMHFLQDSRMIIDLLSDSEDSGTDYKKSRTIIEIIDDDDDDDKSEKISTSVTVILKAAAVTAKASLRQDSSAYGKTLQRKLQAQRFLALNDQSLAKSLQDGEERSRPKRVDGHAELLAMNKTILGKSVLLVDGVNKVISEFNNSNPKLNSMDIKPVAKEDIVYFMERMLETQA